MNLFAMIPSFGKHVSISRNNREYPTNIPTLLIWLDGRKVALQVLLLSGRFGQYEHMENDLLNGDITIPQLQFIETLFCTGIIPAPEAVAKALLRACPSVCEWGYTSDFLHYDENLVARVPKLKSIIVWNHEQYVHSPGSFRAIVPQLREMRISEFCLDTDMVQILVETCPLLEVLSIKLEGRGFAGLLHLIRSCEHLRELSLNQCRLEWTDVLHLVTFRQIKRLSIYFFDDRDDCLLNLAAMLESRPDIERLDMLPFCSYSSHGDLTIHSNQWEMTTLARLLDCIPCRVNVLRIMGAHLQEDVAELVGVRLGSELRELVVRIDGFRPLETLLQRCASNLESLSVSGSGDADSCLQFIGAHLGQLESLSLGPRFADTASAQAMTAVFAGCQRLKTLGLNGGCFTVNTLQAIIDSNLRVQRLDLKPSGFNDQDVTWFRQQCKEGQLLPVPEVVK